MIPDSIASLDGRLRKDDRILNINGRELKGMTQGDALTFLKDIPKVINLGVKRGGDDSDGDAFSRPASSVSRQSRSGSISSNIVQTTPTLSPASLFSARPQSAPHGVSGNQRNEVSQHREGRSGRSRTQSRGQVPSPSVSTSARRSRSETRDNDKSSTGTPETTLRKRPSSVSRLSRFFRGSSESINNLGKEDKSQKKQQKQPKQQKVERKRSGSQKKKKKSLSSSQQPFSLLTVVFEKTDKHSFDFTLTGGVNTVYGDLPILVQTVRKGSELYKSLKTNDELVSVQGIDVSRFPVAKVTDFLSHLPVGRVCMVVQRKS